jgi:protein-tyrosine phosphatase
MLVLAVAIFSALTVVFPLLYVIIYLCTNKGKLKGIVDSLGLLLQPIILARKAAMGKPRFNEMTCNSSHKLFLGAQPDKFGGFRPLFGAHNIRTVVSLNSEKERAGNLWMAPPTEKEYSEHGIEYFKVTLCDHSPLTVSMLAMSADKIQEGLQRGDVYVHCKAGQGRSAQGVLAYYMKFEHRPVDEAISQMQHDRPNITLKTADQIAALKGNAKLYAKQQERYDFYESFSRQHCSPTGTDAGAAGGAHKRHTAQQLQSRAQEAAV